MKDVGYAVLGPEKEEGILRIDGIPQVGTPILGNKYFVINIQAANIKTMVKKSVIHYPRLLLISH